MDDRPTHDPDDGVSATTRDGLTAASDEDMARLMGEHPDLIAERDPVRALQLSLYALTAEQWFGLLTGDPDGVLPPCCSVISDLRDELVELARMPTPPGAAAAVRSICALEDHGLGAHLTALSDALADVLDVARPGWLDAGLGVPDPQRELVMRAHLELTGHYGPDSTYEPKPREEWVDGVRHAVWMVRELVGSCLPAEPEAWWGKLEELDAALVHAMRAGAPLQVLLSLRTAAQELRPS